MSKYGDFSGPYFAVFGLNTRKYEPEKTPYLDTFHAVKVFLDKNDFRSSSRSLCPLMHCGNVSFSAVI